MAHTEKNIKLTVAFYLFTFFGVYLAAVKITY